MLTIQTLTINSTSRGLELLVPVPGEFVSRSFCWTVGRRSREHAYALVRQCSASKEENSLGGMRVYAEKFDLCLGLVIEEARNQFDHAPG